MRRLYSLVPNCQWMPVHLGHTSLNENVEHILYIADTLSHPSQFAASALDWLKKGFRPATWLQYNRMFAQFIAFLEIENIPLLQVNPIVLLSFMEF